MGGSRKSLIIFSVIMTCIFVGTAVTIQSVIRNKEKLPTPTTKQKGILLYREEKIIDV